MWSDDLKRYVWRFKATRIIKICLKGLGHAILGKFV